MNYNSNCLGFFTTRKKLESEWDKQDGGLKKRKVDAEGVPVILFFKLKKSVSQVVDAQERMKGQLENYTVT